MLLFIKKKKYSTRRAHNHTLLKSIHCWFWDSIGLVSARVSVEGRNITDEVFTRIIIRVRQRKHTCRIRLLLLDKLKLIPFVLSSDPLLSQHPGDVMKNTQLALMSIMHPPNAPHPPTHTFTTK